MMAWWKRNKDGLCEYNDSYTLRIEGALNGLSSKACLKIIKIARKDTRTHKPISLTINDAISELPETICPLGETKSDLINTKEMAKK